MPQDKKHFREMKFLLGLNLEFFSGLGIVPLAE